MDILQSFLLGLIQGLTEFLPISSSGHLALGRYFLGADTEVGITFEVVVHFGTLCSIVIYYKTELANLIKAGFGFLASPSTKKDDPDVRVILFILVSMIPAMIIGFTMEDQIEDLISNPVVVCGLLIVTGLILFLTKFAKSSSGDVTFGKSILIGIAQAFAILPGISRSGSTISMALYLGISRENAANFSFLMVIPVIGGAMLLKTVEVVEVYVATGALEIGIASLIVGFLTSFISGYYALKYLIIILKKKGFHYFAYYCWIVGAVGLVYFLV
ncbi:MAG: undecaprenyl-diphosphate phosphatase [Balneolaceae bacterium]